MDGGKDLIVCSFGDEYISKDNNVVELAAERLGCEYENFAFDDASNNYIQYEITKRAIQFENEPVIFIIGWTDPNRLDAEHEGNYFTYRPDKTEYTNTLMNKLHRYDDYLFDEIVRHSRWAAQVYGVQQLLENNHINYYMFNTQKKINFNKYTEKIIKEFDHNKYYDCINNDCALLNYDEDKFSKLISKKCRQLGYVDRP